MGWIKRNLFFVVGGILTLGLLGAAGFFIYQGWSSNSAASQSLDEIYAQLKGVADTQPQPGKPGDDKHDNIKKAREQEQQVRDWINQTRGFFRPIPAIPPGEVTSKNFSSALNSNIYQMQQEARDYGVTLPPQYYFSFQVQSSKLTISSGLAPLAQELGEVRAITDVLFAARVNDLENIQRVRVSDDDATGSGLQSDYTDQTPITNALAIITPYVVTFKTFTPELARVLTGFATSPHPFVVKSVAVQPAGGSASAAEDANATDMAIQTAALMNRNRRRGVPVAEPPPPVVPMPGKGGLPTVLKEQLLRITLEVDIVKLLSKS